MAFGDKFDELEDPRYRREGMPVTEDPWATVTDITNVGNLEDFDTGGGIGGGGGAGDGGAGKPSYAFPKVPKFLAPEFAAPTYEQALAEPGFAFRLKSGTDALERAAAARGVLRTGGTLKDIIEYGQQFGSQEYSNVFNRALQTYGTQYQAAKDEYAPRLAQWAAQFDAEKAAALAAFAASLNRGGGGGGGYDPIIDVILNTPPPAAPQF